MVAAKKPGSERRRRGWIIAMDGPAGVGKSTVGRLVAGKLGFGFLNTGEMFRALAWKCLQQKVDPSKARSVLALAKKLSWEFRTLSGAQIRTFVDGELVDKQIRQEKVSRAASTVAAHPGVRTLMRKMQRDLGKAGRIVMEGRDITTAVFPDADFKIYLDASIDERAKRRYAQLKTQGFSADLDTIRKSIRARDMNDIRRKVNPLKQAEDAIVIDSSRLTLQQVARKIIKYIKARERRRTDKKK